MEQQRRRDFLRSTAALSAAGLAAAIGRGAAAAPATAPATAPAGHADAPQRPNTYQYRHVPDNPRKRKPDGLFNGVQIGPFSLLDEGIDRCLDLLQETAAANALLVYSHLYGAGMEVPKEVLADDHGVPVRLPSSRRLPRVWVRHSDAAFAGAALRHAPPRKDDEYADHDLFAELAEPMRKRGMRLLARVLEPQGAEYAHAIPGWTRGLTVDLHGRLGSNGCWNNPDYRTFWLATVEDLAKGYPIDGFMFGAERVGPLSRVLFRGHVPSCFCRHCLARAKDKGIDATRVRHGFAELHAWVNAQRQGAAAPADGAFTELLRFLLRYPELLAWEHDWAQSLEEVITLVASTVKTLRPAALVGRHVDHQQTSWDFLYRASVRYADMADAVDFIKPTVYHDIAGPRVRQWFVDRARQSFLRGMGADQTTDLFYALAGLDATREPAYAELRDTGLSPDYVFRETKRCVAGADGKAAVYPGVAMDVPFHGPDGIKPFPSQPEGVYQATLKAFEAEADGIVVCREYHEMRLPNLRAVGRAVRETVAARGAK